jgi:hypothetical protein
MTDPERDHFVHRVRDLERRLRRWRLACLVALGLVAFLIVLGGMAGMRIQQERAAREEHLRATIAEVEAALRASEILQGGEAKAALRAAKKQVGQQPEKDKD